MQNSTRAALDEGALETADIQSAIDRAAQAGGGVVTISPGVHRTGALRLRSFVELRLEMGAILRFVPDPDLYPAIESSWEGAPARVHSPCISARGETDVAITGLGRIDGGGAAWWHAFRHDRASLAHPRPTLLGFDGCTRVTIADVTLTNSPSWTVHPMHCDDVRVAGVRIINPPDSPNTDGINPESSRNVRITGCHIDVGDDCIAIKSGTERADAPPACENIVIANCTMLHGHGGVVIGSEMTGGVRGVVISDCVFDGTDRGIRLKTRRGRGGVVEDVRVSNIVMRSVACPVVINPFYFCGPDGKAPRVSDRSALPADDGTPAIRRIHISGLSATGVTSCAGFLSGLPERPLTDIALDDVAISFAEDPTPSVPAMADGVPEMAAAGFRIAFAEGVRLSRVSLTGLDGEAVAQDGAHVTTSEVTIHER